MASMTSREKESILNLIKNKYGGRAALGSAIDMAGGALGFVDDAVSPAATKLQNAVVKGVTNIDKGYPLEKLGMLTNKGKVVKGLASANALNMTKGLVGLGAVGGVLGAADVLAGQDSAGNKLMDSVAMGIGGFLGAPGGAVGIAAGAGTGKMISDATQWLFGDKKTPDQRKLEEALALLNGGRI